MIRTCNLCHKQFQAAKFERFCHDCKDESKRIQGNLSHIVVKRSFKGRRTEAKV